MHKKKAAATRKRIGKKTHCGVPAKIVSDYGICEVACAPPKKKKCDYHKAKK